MVTRETLQSFTFTELARIRHADDEQLRGEFLHAGHYVRGLEKLGLTHEEANEVNNGVRVVIWDRATELGIDLDAEVPG